MSGHYLNAYGQAGAIGLGRTGRLLNDVSADERVESSERLLPQSLLSKSAICDLVSPFQGLFGRFSHLLQRLKHAFPDRKRRTLSP